MAQVHKTETKFPHTFTKERLVILNKISMLNKQSKKSKNCLRSVTFANPVSGSRSSVNRSESKSEGLKINRNRQIVQRLQMLFHNNVFVKIL